MSARVAVWELEGAVERLRALRAAGHSASEIAVLLGREFERPLTRSAVLGKLHRMGCGPPRGPTPEPRPAAEAVRVAGNARGRRHGGARALPPPRPRTAPAPVLEDMSFARPWEARQAGQCAWPIGESPDLWSCCAPTEETYCPRHRARMVLPGSRMDEEAVKRLLESAA